MLPSLSMIPNDPEESARVQYAATIAALAARAKHFLTQAQLQELGGRGARSRRLRRLRCAPLASVSPCLHMYSACSACS